MRKWQARALALQNFWYRCRFGPTSDTDALEPLITDNGQLQTARRLARRFLKRSRAQLAPLSEPVWALPSAVERVVGRSE